MRASFRSAGSFVTLFSSLLVGSVGLVACGGETASLGSQGSEQGGAGASGSGNAGASGNAGKAGAGGAACATIVPTCGGGEYLATDPATGCQVCRACPDGECDECPALTPPSPGFCKNGEIVPQKNAQGCDIAPKCVCSATEPDPGCPSGTTKVVDLDGGCTYSCQPASCPELPIAPPDSLCGGAPPLYTYDANGCVAGYNCPGCIEIVQPGPAQCPSGGFVPKYGPDGCLESYTCLSCPVLGDPSFCADGTIAVGVKDGKCDYGKISCVPCNAAEPPVENFCNDGKKVVKQDGKCLDAALCVCPEIDACSGTATALPVPGSHCGAIHCNPLGCAAPTPQPTPDCAGPLFWQTDEKGCATQLSCGAADSGYRVRLGHQTQAQIQFEDFCVAYETDASGQPKFEPVGLYARAGLDKATFAEFAALTKYLPLEKKPVYFGLATGTGCAQPSGQWATPTAEKYQTLLAISYSGEGFALLPLGDSGPASVQTDVNPQLRFINASGDLSPYDVTVGFGGNAPTALFSSLELAQSYDYKGSLPGNTLFTVDAVRPGSPKETYDFSGLDGLSFHRATALLTGPVGAKSRLLICEDSEAANPAFNGGGTVPDSYKCVRVESE